MCGISLIVDRKNNPVEESQIREMNNKVIHRGPDDEGYYHGENFAFGHRRLCILDLSQAGHQPMIRDNYCINFNGEIYNYVELIEELKGLGHIFKGHSDTELLLPAYWEWGLNAFDKFNGMWAFMIYDASNQEIVLCRDRFGVKPLYYTQVGDLFLAASEIKQFSAISAFKPVLNKKAAVNFLSTGLLNYSEETFFEGVSELRPGHYLRYDIKTHEISIHQWYNLEASIRNSGAGGNENAAAVHDLLSESVNIRMRADVQVGSCLSGGIDSSSIVSLIHRKKLATDNFCTITSCYEDKEYDEQEYSDEVSRHTGFRSVKVFPQLNDLFDKEYLDKMIYHHDQPFSTASHYSEFSVFKTARENKIIVLLDGQGSDEYFCGYDDFFTLYIKELLIRGKFKQARQNLRYRAKIMQISIGKQWQEVLRSAFWYPMLHRIKRIAGKTEYPWLKKEWQSLANRNLVDFKPKNIRDLTLQQMKHTSLPYQLHSADRNSMFFSLEVREPFMDYRLIEYVIGLPEESKIRKGYSKMILREAITELPERVKNRNHKMGFVAPDKLWVLENKTRIREELDEAIGQLGIFSKDLLARFDRFTAGQLEYEPLYFRVMTLNRFCKIFKVQVN